jgi:FtsH-binding integral membrane protein
MSLKPAGRRNHPVQPPASTRSRGARLASAAVLALSVGAALLSYTPMAAQPGMAGTLAYEAAVSLAAGLYSLTGRTTLETAALGGNVYIGGLVAWLAFQCASAFTGL